MYGAGLAGVGSCFKAPEAPNTPAARDTPPAEAWTSSSLSRDPTPIGLARVSPPCLTPAVPSPPPHSPSDLSAPCRSVASLDMASTSPVAPVISFAVSWETRRTSSTARAISPEAALCSSAAVAMART